MTTASSSSSGESQWGARVLVVDATAYDPLRLTWRVGHLITAPRRFTHRLYVRSWDEAMQRLCDIAQRQRLSELQFWGHGGAGSALIGKDVLDSEYLRSSPHFQRWASMRPFQPAPSPLIWFRTCYTMRGEAGRAFAALLSSLLYCRVAGFTQYIHLLQRGLVLCQPGQPCQWTDDAAGGGSVLFCSFSPAALSPVWGAAITEAAAQ